ncbi:S8 family serine peptidase [Pyrococcus sp. ST04]|uniref:S8 family peptidase n=1 Tax=Pyrococcus sp. ST04 TaxID=1183377 RepID=UPI0002605E6D|nr:S8 family serine peptidase [Pyrococcus sp. ST04]AFK23182.1 putative stetterlysin [Pyrococcus sp. ST04]
MDKKVATMLLVFALVLSVFPPATMALSQETTLNFKKSNGTYNVQAQISKILKDSTNEENIRVIIATKKEGDTKTYEEIAKLGKILPISRPEFKFIVAIIPKDKLQKLKEISGIEAVWKDRKIYLPKPQEDTININPKEAPKMFISDYTTGAYYAWTVYGVLGDNVTVAVLDTGVDVANPFLQVTLDGKPKIIDVHDSTDEGLVELTKVEYNSTLGGFKVGNTTYLVPQVTECTNVTYYFGYLPERYFDINFNGNITDEFPVAIGTCDGNVVFASLDIDQDNNLTESEYIIHGVYRDTLDYIVTPENLSIALADFSPINSTNAEAHFFWDGHGHGTHVSGTIAGVGLPTDPLFNGTYGIAPNAQIMGVRVLVSAGYGYASWIIAGMLYAAVGPDGIPGTGDEADVINMSLGGWLDYNDGTDNPEDFFVNYITEKFGVVFAIAAGNEGPALNTGGSPGTADFAITVGAYAEGIRWEVFYDIPGVQNGMAYFSSRGPRMDGMLDPDISAPGRLIFSSLPIWRPRRYGIWSGTSMATPHVAGAAALLISYAKSHNLNYDPFKIKQALMLSATKTEGLSYADEGFGFLNIPGAIQILENLSNEKSVIIYAGVPVTTFKTPLGTPWIPANKLNSYMVVEYGLPYLYRGIYLRNEHPASVPVEVYSLNYNGTLKVYTTADWIKPSVTELNVSTSKPSSFTVSIDYTKLQKPGLYEAIIYIDDPSTTYIEGYVPVTILIPEKPENGEVKFVGEYDTKSMRVNRYFFEIPEDVSKVEVSVTTNSHNDICFQLVPPQGTQMLRYIGYDCFGLRNRTITFNNPTPGTWELVVFGEPQWTDKEKITYEFDIKLYGIMAEPNVIRVDLQPGEEKTVEVKVTNKYSTFLGKTFTTDNVEKITMVLNSGNWTYFGFPDTSDILYLEAGTIPLDSLEELWIEMGTDLNSDYPMFRVARGGVVDAILPKAPAYVYAEGYYGEWVFYLLTIRKGDKESSMLTVSPTDLAYFFPGESRTLKLKVKAGEKEGTYFGAIGIEDQFGNVLGVIPVIIQVGMPELEVKLVQPESLEVGEEGNFTLWILDKATSEPITGKLLKVIINGVEYYTNDGKVEFSYTPTKLDDKIAVDVISEEYQDFHGTFNINVKEPVTTYVTQPQTKIVEGTNVKITKETKVSDGLEITVEGETGTTATLMIMLPENAKVTGVEAEVGHVLSWWVDKGDKATYLFVEVKFSSPVVLKVRYYIPRPVSIESLNMLSYAYYNIYLEKYKEILKKAKEVGVSDDVLKQAEALYSQALEYYQKVLELTGGDIIGHLRDIRMLPFLRQAYVSLRKATELLEEAIAEAQGGSE